MAPAPALARSSSKRKRAPDSRNDEGASPTKLVRVQSDIDARPAKDATGRLDETRRVLLKLFAAIEATLLSSLSLSTFHSIQDAVRTTSRCDFEILHLGQILGVWDGAYLVSSSTTVIKGMPTPTLEIGFPTDILSAGSSSTSSRRAEFEHRLGSWTGTVADLPKLEVQPHMPINQNKINLMRKSTAPKPALKSIAESSTSDRKDALLERLRLKALQKASLPSGAEIKDATILAMIPNAVQSIKILLASRRHKAIGMRELSDNLCTSLNDRMARQDVEHMIEALAKMPKYATWCKVGIVGDVKIVRFVGLPPVAV